MAGYLNAKLEDPEGTPQREAIADDLEAVGLMNIGVHFLPCCNPWLQDRCKWSMQRDGQEVWSRKDYILGIDCRVFQDVYIRYTQHQSDHFMALGCLRGDQVKELTGYLCKACRFPPCLIRSDLVLAPDNIFSDLKTHIPNPPLSDQVRRAWISDNN